MEDIRFSVWKMDLVLRGGMIVSSTPVKREYIVTGADPSTIEENLYSKEAIEEAMQKIRNANKAEESYGSDSDDSGWGDSSLGEADEEDEAW